jgi:hypothetical protein
MEFQLLEEEISSLYLLLVNDRIIVWNNLFQTDDTSFCSELAAIDKAAE